MLINKLVKIHFFLSFCEKFSVESLTCSAIYETSQSPMFLFFVYGIWFCFFLAIADKHELGICRILLGQLEFNYLPCAEIFANGNFSIETRN